MQSKKQNITTSGATAVGVLLETDKVDPTKRTLHVGNIGDSRAVLVSTKYPETGQVPQDGVVAVPDHGFQATRLTFDHRAEDPGEQERIKTAGGFVTRNRVLGILAVSRSFGDHGMKDFVIGEFFVMFSLLFEFLFNTGRSYVAFVRAIDFLSLTHTWYTSNPAATPFVTETDLTQCGEAPMLILACDGVWDVFSDQEAADLLVERYLREGPFEDAARMLVRPNLFIYLYVYDAVFW